MTLREWIEKEGVRKLARKLDVAEATVNHWRRGFVMPRGSMHMKIIRLSGGKIDMYQSTLDHFSPKNKSRSGVVAKRTRK